MGWICPKCGRVWAYWISGCRVCNGQQGITGTDKTYEELNNPYISPDQYVVQKTTA